MSAAAKAYHARMQRVLDHIDAHLDEDLDVERLAAVAAFSKFHFHRQFSELFGLAVHRYVQLARLKRASFRLAFRDDSSVTQIALDSDYQGPEAFARAFRRLSGQTPSGFRKDPQWLPWQEAYGPFNQDRSTNMQPFTDDKIDIIDVPATPVAIMTHLGDPALIGENIRRFSDWRKQAGLRPPRSATFNILHNDPLTTPPQDYRLDLCAATSGAAPSDDPAVAPGLIPAGRCARLRVTGASDDVRPAVSFLYADWLPRSGEALRDFPIYVQRISFFPDVPEAEAVTDIFLPLV